MSEQVRLSFQKWDVRGKGAMLKDELASMLRSLDPETTNEELEALFSAAQIDYKDNINYERFVTWLFSDAPDVFGKLGISEFNVAAQSKCLWEVALSAALAESTRQHPKSTAKVESYFADVRSKLIGPAFTEDARIKFSARCVNTQDNLANFQEVVWLLDVLLQRPVGMVQERQSVNETRLSFDAHISSQGSFGVEEFVNLLRYLQVQVALATFLEAEARSVQNLKQLQLNTEGRERGLWEETMAVCKAKACQRFSASGVEMYFDGVGAQLSSAEYATHVKGALFIKIDANKDGKVSFEEALDIITNSLRCAADVGGSQKPTPEAIREVFAAHDTLAEGWDFMGGDEFLNLMRYLQVQVAEAMLPLSKMVKEG